MARAEKPKAEARGQHPPAHGPVAGYATLGVISFGLAVGVAFALFVFLLGIVATLFGWGAELAAALSSLFIGYAPNFVGSITGAVWAFVDGFVGGVLIAWLYNRFLLRRAQQVHRRL